MPGARQNANDWQAYLTGTLKVPAERVALLLDGDATADPIRQAAADKAVQVGEGGLLVGIDAQQKAESIYARSLSRNALLRALSKGKQAKTVVLIDACFSGGAPSGQALVAGLQPLIAMRAVPPGMDNRMILMTAAKSDQFAVQRKTAEEAKQKRIEARDAGVVPEADKTIWSAEFLKAYWKYPGIEPEMAKAQAAYLRLLRKP